MRKLTDFKTGTVLPRGERLNEIQAAIRDLQNSRTSAPPRQQIVAECLGVITDKGPNGEQYATGQTKVDERHWVQLSYFKPAKVWDQLKANPDKLITPNIVYATNLPDLANHSHSLSKGVPVRVWGWLDRGTPRKLHWICESARTNGIFRVNLSQDGGSAGSATTAPSWTYTVTDDDSNTLGTTMSPARGRDYNGKRNAASLGYAHYDKTGTFILDEAWESPGTVPCT